MSHTACHLLTGRPLWSLTEDVLLWESDAGLVARTRWGDVLIDDRCPAVYESLRRMSLGPVTLENVAELREDLQRWRSGSSEPCSTWHRLWRVLDRLAGCVVASMDLADGRAPVVSVVPLSADVTFFLPLVTPASRVEPSDGFRIEDDGDRSTVMARSAPSKAELRRPATDVARRLLLGGCSVEDIAAATQLRAPLVIDVVAYLAGAGVVTAGPPAH